ncbi:Histone-lysine N-methyltransferase EHMT2 [Lucilia cuprina]|nr:Histone-lysine N-methyltransferase EHMT2 [Lucilia cuprina]
MTDCLEGLLSSMVNTFNSDCPSNAEVDLTDDKTLKWRNLSKNQFAAKDKDKKPGVKSMTTTAAAEAAVTAAESGVELDKQGNNLNKQESAAVEDKQEQKFKKENDHVGGEAAGGEVKEKSLATEENLEQTFKDLLEEEVEETINMEIKETKSEQLLKCNKAKEILNNANSNNNNNNNSNKTNQNQGQPVLIKQTNNNTNTNNLTTATTTNNLKQQQEKLITNLNQQELNIKIENLNEKEMLTTTTTKTNTTLETATESAAASTSPTAIINLISPSPKTLVGKINPPTTDDHDEEDKILNINKQEQENSLNKTQITNQNKVNEKEAATASTITSTTPTSSLQQEDNKQKEETPTNNNKTVKADNETEKHKNDKPTNNNNNSSTAATAKSTAQTLKNNNTTLTNSPSSLNNTNKPPTQQITKSNNNNNNNTNEINTNHNNQINNNGATTTAKLNESAITKHGDVTTNTTKEVLNNNNNNNNTANTLHIKKPDDVGVNDVNKEGELTNNDVKGVKNNSPSAADIAPSTQNESLQKSSTDLDDPPIVNAAESNDTSLIDDNKPLIDKHQPASKRGRGRNKKYSNTDADSNHNTTTNELPIVERHSSPQNTERKLTRKRKNPADDEIELAGLLNKSEDEEGKRTRRSERLCNRLDGFKIFDEEKEPSDDNNKNHESNESPTRKTLRLALDEKTPPKKRGRKAKVQLETEKMQEDNNEQNTSSTTAATTNYKKHNSEAAVILPKRSQRRIKPTTKILENDELRYEFETKNIVRMTAQNWSSSEQQQQNDSTTPTHQIVSQSEHNTTTNSKQKSEKSDNSNDSHPTGTSNIKKKLFPCPDIKKFLQEIKSGKWNQNRSPEDKKLSKKQQRKLNKQKEKYFERMGLRRNVSNESSDNDSLSDNAEFVPTTRVQVGKPSVTLRGRKDTTTTQPATAAATTTQRSVSSSSTPPQTRRNQRQKTISTNADKVVELKSLNASVVAENISANTPTPSTTAQNTSSNASTSLTVPETSAKTKFDCLCHVTSNYCTPMIKETQYCWAIDNIDEEKVGCSHQLTGEVLNLFRASQRSVYMVLCEEHQKRLKAHNSCPACGIFCTQWPIMAPYKWPIYCCARVVGSDFINMMDRDSALPLCVAVKEGKVVPDGLYCLHIAARTGNLEILKLIVHSYKASKDVSQFLSFINAQDDGGWTAMVWAAELAYFWQQGADPNICDNDNNTVLHWAALQNHTWITITVLLKAGINCNIQNVEGETPLDEIPPKTQNTPASSKNAMSTHAAYDTPEPHSTNYMKTQTCAQIPGNTKAFPASNYCLDNSPRLSPRQLYRIVRLLLSWSTSVSTSYVEYLTSDETLQTHNQQQNLPPRNDDWKEVAERYWLQITMLQPACVNFIMAPVAFSGPLWHHTNGLLYWLCQAPHCHYVCWSKEEKCNIVNLFLQNRADLALRGPDGHYCLHIAARTGNLEILKLIMMCVGTAMVWAAELGHTDIVRHIACRLSSKKLCLLLIFNGADLMLRNRSDELPYDCIPDEHSDCARHVGFQMEMHALHRRRSNIVCGDISNGRELCPIQALRNENNVMPVEESDQLMLPDFRYITDTIILQNSVQIDQRVSQMRICNCSDGCTTDSCQCTGASDRSWYTAEGRLSADFNFEDPAVLFECNDVCNCNKRFCKNRVVQNGITIPLQVIECEDSSKGWGVRTMVHIPKGSFVAVYTGEVLTEMEADRRTDDSYFFDLGHNHCIDANYYGNVSRFFNHSCEPNIVPVRVFYQHQDYRFPKISFFTCRDIEVGEEICFDYGDKFWSIKNRYFTCKCQSTSCRYSSLLVENGEEEMEDQEIPLNSNNEIPSTLTITSTTNSSNISHLSNNSIQQQQQQQQQQIMQAELLLPNNNELSIIPINPSTSLASLPSNTTNGTP